MLSPSSNRPKAYSYIRMSTDVQLQGDSLRRQLAASQRYAADHDLELVSPIEDIGVSGYRGSNREFGNLARFLEQIDGGLVERGSYLIVESLDRLSRQNVLQAFSLLGQIIGKGIKVVTLMDGQTYDEVSFTENQGQIFLALGSMLRAHEESRVKSKRVAEAWVQKRKEAGSKVLTRVVPSWLEASEDRTRVRIRPERQLLVKEIFELARDGYGAYSIARRFNKRNEPTWTPRATLWHESYVKKILENRAVLGEYQPGAVSYEGGSKPRRIPVGEPIVGYFPAAIDEELFLAAHAAINARRTGGRGRKGLAYSNLFTGIAKCGHCGYPMRVMHKGGSIYTKEGQYLRCSSSRSQAGCSSPAWKYIDFEQSFVRFLRKVDLRYVLGGKRQDELVLQLQNRRLLIDSEIASKSQAIENLVAAIESGSVALGRRVAELEGEVAKLRLELNEVVASLNDIDQSRAVMSADELLGLLDRITPGSADAFDDAPRRLLASEIRRVIREIELFSYEATQPWHTNDPAEAAWIEGLSLWERRLLSSHYIVHYKTGESEYIKPLEKQSLMYPTNTRESIEAIRQRRLLSS